MSRGKLVSNKLLMQSMLGMTCINVKHLEFLATKQMARLAWCVGV